MKSSSIQKLWSLCWMVALAVLPAWVGAQPLITHEDESKVPSYILPDLLTSENGKPILSAEAWRSLRRPELLELFTHQMFGEAPSEAVELSSELLTDQRGLMDGAAHCKEVVIHLRPREAKTTLPITVLIYQPAGSPKPVPAFLALNFAGNHTLSDDPQIRLSQTWMRNQPDRGIVDHRATEASRGTQAGRWPVRKIIDRGYALVTAYYGDIDPDFDDGWSNGIHPFFFRQGQQAPEVHQWGSIAAWAWGLSRILDYLHQEPTIDPKRVAVMGHSRLGKTALWAGASDERFALVISNNSGCGGAALSRRAYGETLRRINSSFPHWFNDAFTRFNDREALLPFDQHQLLALIAPRPLYVASAAEDQWADPKGEFLSAWHASSVYRLLGSRGIESGVMPALDEPVGDQVRYHIRRGPHDVTDYDWAQYLDFADAHLK